MRCHPVPVPVLVLVAGALVACPAGAQVPGMALSLDGVNDIVNTNQPPGQPAALTVAAWVRLVPGPSGAGTIVGNHFHGTQWESWELNAANFGVNSAPSAATRQSCPFPRIDDGTWHHVAGVWDGDSSVVYVDGVIAAGPVAAPLGPWASPYSLSIGGRRSTETPPVSSDASGLIDELQIWSVARTADEIAGSMHAVLGPEYTEVPGSGLVGYWRFEQLHDDGFLTPGANDARDASSSGYLGDVLGATLASTGTVAAPVVDAPGALRLAAFPNPFRSAAEIVATGGADRITGIAVFDVTGRRVAAWSGADARRTWNGEDFSGRRVGTGVYLVRACTERGATVTTRLVRVR